MPEAACYSKSTRASSCTIFTENNYCPAKVINWGGGIYTLVALIKAPE